MLLNPFTLHRPHTAKEAAGLFSELDHVKIQAGGTFLLNSLKQLKAKGVTTPKHIICLNNIKKMSGIEINEETCIIRAMTTIDEIYSFSHFPEDLAFLKRVSKNISTQPIRNMASFGGNLTCRYTWTEMPAVMVAMEALLHFIDREGKQHAVPAEDFFANQAKSEYLFTHASFKRKKGSRLSYQRVRKSASVDIPLLSLLIRAEVSNTRLVNIRTGVNNCVQFAQRDKKLEDFLNGKKVDPKIPDQCLDNLDTAIYDTRSSDYKKHMFRISIKNALKEIIS